MNALERQAPKPANAPIRDGKHYLHLLGRAKWFLLLMGPTLFLVVVAFMFLVVRPENPELVAQALIGLERTPDTPGTKKAAATNLGREDIMMSRTFLRDVVRKLSLQLQTSPADRNEMFDSISIDSSAACGTYWVRFGPHKNDDFSIYYFDTTAVSLPIFGVLPGKNTQLLASGHWADSLPIVMPGMSLKFSRSLQARPNAFMFHVVDIRHAVEAVYRNLTIKRADPDKGVNYISVHVSGRDYALAAATANAIADAFIDKNLSFRQSRTRGIAESLDKQLLLAQANLASAESKISDFRLANPQVGLSSQTQQTVTSLAQLDNGIQSMSADMATATNLEKETLNADSAQRLQVAGVTVDFLLTHGIIAGKALSEELNRLLAERHAMTGKYGAQHPVVLENNRALQKLSQDILAALYEYISSTQTAISMKQQHIQRVSGTLRQLPAQEMALGELERNQKIFADIYSALLGSYNQAKVASAVEASDVYIMDYAVAPLPPPVDRNRLLIACVLIVILGSFGPVLAYDVFDKSVRSQRQLARITGKRVLEAIPIFSNIGEKHGLHDPVFHPLISVPCDPNFTRETFDSLLVKIKLCMMESTDNSIVVSGHEGDCGKSTLCANLAIAMAMRGHRTLLADGDLRRGTVRDIFCLPESGGLAALLSGKNPLTEDDCVRSIFNTKIPGLCVIPSGQEPQNPGNLLSSPRMDEFRRFCGKHMAYMILDTPPLGVVSDAVAVQKLFSHYIFVVRSGKTNVAELVNRINEFDQLPEKILGYVLNGASHEAVGTYQRYSKYYGRNYTRARFFNVGKKFILPAIKNKSVFRSSTVMLIAALLIGLGIAAIRGIPPALNGAGQMQRASVSVDPAIYRAAQVTADAAQLTQAHRTPLGTESSVAAAPLKKEQIKPRVLPASDTPTTVSETAAPEKRGEATTIPASIDENESILATLKEIRRKSAQGDLTALDSIFKGPPLDDGEYFVHKARFFCVKGEWQKALPLVERAFLAPARGLSEEQLKLEYFLCKAKCLGAAFEAEPTPSRAEAAMEAWYEVKYQFRKSPQDSCYLLATREVQRINKEMNGR